jgi:protein TonB
MGKKSNETVSEKKKVQKKAAFTGGTHRHLSFLSVSLLFHLVIALILSLFILIPEELETVSNLDITFDVGKRGGGKTLPSVVAEEKYLPTPDPESPLHREENDVVSTAPPTEGENDHLSMGLDSGPTGSSDRELSAYIFSVREKIERKKHYPKHSLSEEAEGTVMVSFLLDSSGSLLSSEIAASSGHASLDDDALETVWRASPYPPFPRELRRERLYLKIPITYELK